MNELDEHHIQSWRVLKALGARLEPMLDRLRHSRPTVFEHLCRTDTEAASIAVKCGWQVGPLPERTEADVERAQESAARAIAAIHAARVP